MINRKILCKSPIPRDPWRWRVDTVLRAAAGLSVALRGRSLFNTRVFDGCWSNIDDGMSCVALSRE